MSSIVEQVHNVCNSIYTQLGPGHSEVVYQTALVLEMYNLGATSVESEKHVPVFFVDTNQVQHTIGNERIDILARFPQNTVVLIELKAVANVNRVGLEHQLQKYIRSLREMNVFPDHKFGINFPQQNDKNQVDFIMLQ
jgi:GxxExxY protein